MAIETRLFINGEFVKSKGSETFDLKNPATDELVAKLPVANKQDIDDAVAAAHAAQPAWADSPARVRAGVLRKLASLLREPKNIEVLAELESISMGRPKAAYVQDCHVSAAILDYVSGLTENVHGNTSLNTPNLFGVTLRQPYGVVAGIIPWNFPSQMWVFKVGPAIGAGNAIVLKSSEKAPLTSIYLAKLAHEAGVPPGILNVVSGAGSTGEIISLHPEIRKVAFTGSHRTGRLVQQAASKSNLKTVTLELGGKSPLLVFEDADIELAAKEAALSISFNSGQICVASSRIYVQKSISAKFTEAIRNIFSQIKQGDPLKEDTQMGPQADSIQLKIVLDYIAIGKQDGKVLIGGNRVGTKGNFIQPTIFTDVPDNSRLTQEEIFGPVVLLNTFETEEEALKRANGTEYGLYASVYTKDVDRAIRIAKGLEGGNIGVNCTSPTMAIDMPFGGVKASGIGRELGPNAVLNWLQEKSVYFKYSSVPEI